MKITNANMTLSKITNEGANLLHVILEQQSLFMVILSPEGIVVEINNFMLGYLNLERDKIIGKHIWSLGVCFDSNECKNKWLARLNSIVKGNSPLISEHVFKLKGGGTHRVKLSTSAILSSEVGRLTGFITQEVEQSSNKWLDETIKNNEQRQNAILKHSHIGHWELNVLDNISHRSLIHDQIFGYDKLLPVWTYEMFLEHVLLEDRKGVDKKFQDAINNKKEWNFECRITRKDKQIRWILGSGWHELDLKGNVKSMVGTVQDITERKQVEQYKIQHAAEIESLFDALPDIYFHMKADGEIIDFHAQQEHELYLQPEDFLGKRMHEVLPPEIGNLFQSKLQDASQIEKTLTFEYQLIIKEKTLHFEARVNRVKFTNHLICVIRNRTEEIRSHDSLELSEQRFRTFFEQAAIGVSLVNYDNGKFIRINQRLCDMFGYTQKEMLKGKTIQAITHPDDLQKSLDYMASIRTGCIHKASLEKRCFHKDTHIVWVEITASKTISDKGDEQTVIVVVQDISNRKYAEEKIITTQKQLLQAETLGKMGSWQLDLFSFASHWSPEIYHILGLSNIHESGLILTKEIVFKEDWPKVESILKNTVQSGGQCKFECRVLLPKGQKRWVFCKAETQNDDSGIPYKLVGILQDITNSKKAIEKKRLAAAVYESTSEGVMITNNEKFIIDVNHAFSQLTGYSRDEVIGKKPNILQSGKHHKSFYTRMWKHIYETGHWTGEIWNRRKDGSVYPELLNISSIRDDDKNITHYIGVFSDITKMKSSEAELYRLAHHDTLTGLPNRLLLNAYLEKALMRAKRQQSSVAVIFFDLDNFKLINDSFGHEIGDLLLKETAQRLQSAIRQTDSVCRISGDEFIILIEDINSHVDANIAVNKLLNLFQKRFSLKNYHVNVTASMGVCLFPQDTKDSIELLRNADAAMYQAKDAGRNSYKFYTREMTTNALERVILETNLRQAIKNEEFYLVYQPQINLSDNKLVGLEVLIRWDHPKLGLISPADFIPLAEETGLIIEIGEWVLRAACLQGKAWLNSGIKFGCIAINVAGPQIKRGNIVNLVNNVLSETQLPAKFLELEVTESYIMQQTDKAIEQMNMLREVGVMLSIDDFGTGYSSLSYLKKLPINKLKIDQSFVHDIPNDQDDMAISKAVIAMGTALGLKVIAEGVETKAQETFLFEAGCQEVQGYFYSKPIEKKEIEEYIIGR